MKTKELEQLGQGIVDEIEQHQLSLWKQGMMTCLGFCHNGTPVTATHRVEQETWHIDHNDEAVNRHLARILL